MVLLFLFEYYSQEIDYAWILTKSIFIYVIGYMAVSQPESLLATSLKEQASAEKESKYKKSGLSEEQANYYYQRLKQIMKEKQPYLNNELDLEMLAKQLSITPNLLSQIINQKTRQNFYGLINQYRIQHAQRLLQQQPNSSSKKPCWKLPWNPALIPNPAFTGIPKIHRSNLRIVSADRGQRALKLANQILPGLFTKYGVGSPGILFYANRNFKCDTTLVSS